MTKPKTLDQLRAEKERAETQLAQEQHKLERLENRKKYLEKGERTKRTHRLCNLGGTIESLAPEVKDLTRTEMTELMEHIFSPVSYTHLDVYKRQILFNELVLSDKLFEHCAEIDEAARNRIELIVRSLAEQNGVTEQLKAENQMEWVRQMNACKAQAEEVVKAELIYD